MARYLWILVALLAAANLAACGITYSTDGLGAIDPPQTIGVSPKVKMPSLTPTLVWETFPQDKVHVEDVTYELRVWRAIKTRPGPLVYERRGIVEPRHTVEVALEHSQNFFWSVRARYRLNGRERVNQWASRNSADVGEGVCSHASRVPIIPNPCAYRLTTPGATP